MDANALQSLITIGIVALAGLIAVLVLVAAFTPARQPQPEKTEPRTYTYGGACRFSHHRNTCRRK